MNVAADLCALARHPLHGVYPQAGGHSVPEEGAADFPFSVELVAGTVPVPPADAVVVWSLHDRGERYETRITLHDSDDALTLSVDCEGRGRFAIGRDRLVIDWEGGTGPGHYLQNTALAVWLERAGVPCIHANAIALNDGEAVALLAPSGTGKSTLSLALHACGWQLLTDDMLALHHCSSGWGVFPGWPQLRLWPASPSADRDVHGLPRVHKRFDKRLLSFEASAAAGCRRLSRLILLDRREAGEGEITLDPIAPGPALVHLLQNSMLGDGYRAMGLENARLQRLALLLEATPLLRLSYPSGARHLDAVCDAIVAGQVAAGAMPQSNTLMELGG